MVTFIASTSNPRISKLQRLHTTRGRKKCGLFLMEGPHLLEALLDLNLLPDEVYYQPAQLQRTVQGHALLERLLQIFSSSHHQLVEVSEHVMKAISDVQTSQGVVSVLPFDVCNPASVCMRRPVAQRPLLLILDDLSDPGNMGTILRTALATDVHTVLLTPNCVDYFSPKVVRAAVGAHLALPVETDLSWQEIAERVTKHNSQQILLAEAGSSQLYYQQNFTQPLALIIGNEAHGPSCEARALATQIISIPLLNNVESLNAAVAAGIFLYEAMRQNQQ